MTKCAFFQKQCTHGSALPHSRPLTALFCLSTPVTAKKPLPFPSPTFHSTHRLPCLLGLSCVPQTLLLLCLPLALRLALLLGLGLLRLPLPLLPRLLHVLLPLPLLLLLLHEPRLSRSPEYHALVLHWVPPLLLLLLLLLALGRLPLLGLPPHLPLHLLYLPALVPV